MAEKSNKAIVLTFHTLKTRGTLFISAFWDCSIMACLVLLVILGIVSSLEIQKLYLTYGGFNILTAKLHFIPKTEQPLNYAAEDTYILMKSSRNDEKLDSAYMEEIDSDIKFITNMKIDGSETIFGSRILRDYMVYYPAFSSIVAFQWCVLLFNYRIRGYCLRVTWNHPQSWQMVIPSIIVFGSMFLKAFIYNYYANYYFAKFCQKLASKLIHPDRFSCGYLMNNLYVSSWQECGFILPTNYHYNIYSASIVFELVVWLTVLLVTLSRWFFGVDFKLYRVTISAFIPEPKKQKSYKSLHSVMRIKFSDYRTSTSSIDT